MDARNLTDSLESAFCTGLGAGTELLELLPQPRLLADRLQGAIADPATALAALEQRGRPLGNPLIVRLSPWLDQLGLGVAASEATVTTAARAVGPTATDRQALEQLLADLRQLNRLLADS